MTQFLLELQQAGSHSLQQLYNLCYEGCRTWLVKNGGTEEDVRDIFHDAIIVLINRLRKSEYHPKDEEHLKAYLFGIVRYTFYRHVRKQGRIIYPEVLLEHPIAESPIAEAEQCYAMQVTAMQRRLQALDEKCRTIIRRFYFDDADYQTMALELKTDAGTVKTMKYRCMQKLRNGINLNVI